MEVKKKGLLQDSFPETGSHVPFLDVFIGVFGEPSAMTRNRVKHRMKVLEPSTIRRQSRCEGPVSSSRALPAKGAWVDWCGSCEVSRIRANVDDLLPMRTEDEGVVTCLDN